jgi:HK97 family phage major capsid protein/HK97 family phage prohead protease
LSVSDTGEITGTAWPFGSPDRVGDVINPGAFTDAAVPMPMLWAHDQAQVVGVWEEITETPTGLTVKGRLLVEDVERAREVRAMIRAGAATGLSIGFQTKAATPRPRLGRTITALSLHEISVVAVPAHPGARITSVKTAETPAPQPHHHEDQMDPQDQVPANQPAIDTKALEAITARLDKIEAKANRPGVAVTGPAEPTLERKAFQHFLRRGVERMEADEVKALVAATDSAGGFLAPEQFGSELIKLLVEHSPIRAFAKVVTIGGSEIRYPKRVSGTGATWVGETEDRTASGMVFDQLTLPAHELATYVDVSNQLLEDNAYNLEGELLADFAETFAKTEGAAFVNGDGVGKPKGIMQAAGIASINTGSASTLAVSAITAAFHAIPQIYAQNAVWMMNRTTLALVRSFSDSMGRHLLMDSLSSTAPSTILGRPVIEMPDMPNVAAGAFPILFGDMSGYRIVDRVGLSTLRDPFTLAAKGQVRFHARKRTGADLTHPDRFVKIKVAA